MNGQENLEGKLLRKRKSDFSEKCKKLWQNRKTNLANNLNEEDSLRGYCI